MRNLIAIITLLFGLSFLSCSNSGTGPESNTSNNDNEEIPTYTVSVSMNPSDAGSLSLSDTTVEGGKEIELQATSDNEYQFSGWTGDIESTDNPYSLTVDRDYDITANFEKKSYKLTVNIEGAGTVAENIIQQKPTEYDHGTVVELKATPQTGYLFTDWTGDLNTTDNPKTIVLDEPKTVTAHFNVKSDKAALKINVDWNNIGTTKNKLFKTEVSDSITHFGARLVYPKQNAVFTQSVAKITADSMGLITMEVPPADSARLLVAAVYFDGKSNNKLINMGVLDELTIDQGQSYEWNVTDINWTEPFWKPADSLASDYENGAFTIDKNKEKFEFYFLVRDPYYPAPDPSLSNYLIRLNGFGGNSGYENGFRIMRQILENPDVGTANQATYNNFFPYLKSEMFQLPSGGPRYVVDKKGTVTINWE
jgi:uncharacterized repeat protein (TIGR02543 family)